MPADPALDVTNLLEAAVNGDQDAVSHLFPLLYDHLRSLARGMMGSERADHTLSATALVNEAFLKLVGQRETNWRNRAQFFAIAALAMRRILVNHAKARSRVKRGENPNRVTLDETVATYEARAGDLVALDEALDRLADYDPRQARIVDLRFFAGLTVEETAQMLELSPRTVHREWSMAKAWLKGELMEEITDES